MSYAKQNPRVIRQLGPARYHIKLPDSRKILLVTWFRYSLRAGTGRQPPATASYPGLPEELMNTDTVNTIVRALGARNAAPRLTQPVSDRYCRARMLAWRQRRQPGWPMPVHNDNSRKTLCPSHLRLSRI